MTSARRKSFLSMVIATIIFIFGITAGMSFAYFSDTKTATSTLSFGKLKIALSDTVGSSTQETITLTPTASGGNNLLAPNDTITLTGSVGLEENSIPAYIRVKVELYETSSTSTTTETKVSAPAFVSGFLSQMSTIKDGDKQWFVKDNYLYYGNAMVVGEPFTYSASNTNTGANKITITDEMLTDTLKGKSVKVKLIYQAIQTSGAFDTEPTLSSGCVQNNATTISTSKLWKNIFPEPDEMYEESSPYYSGYVHGNLIEVNNQTYTEYTNSLTTSKGSKSPFAFFKKDEDDATTKGNYVAFGWYPQTVIGKDVTIVESYGKFPNENGFDCYLGSDGGLYVQKKVEKNNNYYFSSETFYTAGTSISATKTTTSQIVTSGVDDNKYYYFKLEPIIWKILDSTTGLLYSVSELTAMSYFYYPSNWPSSNAVRTINGTSVNPNNYEHSEVRAYLNGTKAYKVEENTSTSPTTYNTVENNNYNGKGLLQQAFSSSQTALQTGNSSKWKKGSIADSGSIVDNNNGDYIFLLSQTDLKNTNFEGYTNSASSNTVRIKYPTDYAIACGAYKSSGSSTTYGGYYWLRSPYSGDSYYAWGVDYGGGLDYSRVDISYIGVVPALFLNLS